ncbi:class I SAM-dependent methyltransferase [Patescibacteria group bacterium]|nr:class I SAM-dependent methyltransferase [Patescibacteria group bacterium]
MNKKQADKILTEVKDSYQIIADHFSRTRYRDWSEFAIFKKYIKSGDKALDAGCGNGRLYDSLQELDIEYQGVDISSKLIDKAKNKYPEAKFEVGDILSLPFADQQFDVLLSIATLHHVPSSKYRKQVIEDFARVIKPGGYLMVTVWNLAQREMNKELGNLPPADIINKDGDQIIDVMRPWKNPQGEVLAKRYLHGFSQQELEQLISSSGFKIIESFYAKRGKKTGPNQAYNLCLIAQKMI